MQWTRASCGGACSGPSSRTRLTPSWTPDRCGWSRRPMSPRAPAWPSAGSGSPSTRMGAETSWVATRGARRIGDVLFSPIDVILSNTAIVQPDIVYLEPARLERISGRGIEEAPTLVEGRRGVTHAEAG